MSNPTMLDLQCLTVLQAALSAEFGIVLLTNDAARARQAIYNFRGKMKDPTLAAVQLRTSPVDSEKQLWLIRLSAVAPAFTVSSADLL